MDPQLPEKCEAYRFHYRCLCNLPLEAIGTNDSRWTWQRGTAEPLVPSPELAAR